MRMVFRSPYEVEKDIRKLIKLIGWPVTSDIVQSRIGLRISIQDLSGNVEAMLVPSTYPGALGEIRLNRLYCDEYKYYYMYEVVEYAFFVGLGCPVYNTFIRHRNKNKDEKILEQYTSAF